MLLLSDLWLQWKVGAHFLHDEESKKAWNEVCLSNTKSLEKNRKLSQYLDYSIQAPDSAFSQYWYLSWEHTQ